MSYLLIKEEGRFKLQGSFVPFEKYQVACTALTFMIIAKQNVFLEAMSTKPYSWRRGGVLPMHWSKIMDVHQEYMWTSIEMNFNIYG